MDTYQGHDHQGIMRSLPRRLPRSMGPDDLEHCGPRHFDGAGPPLGVRAFDALLLDHCPDDVRERIENILDQATALSHAGRADRPPPRDRWVRTLSLSWLHSRDMTAVMSGLGYPKDCTGVHDIEETVLGRHIKARLEHVDPWYRAWAEELGEDEPVNIGCFNPNLAASFFNRGLDPQGPMNASHAHLLSDHHLGTPEHPIDFVEQAANWVVHQLPREHHGVHHRPLAAWSSLPDCLRTDALARASELLRTIAVDAASVMQALERSGQIIPWHRLDLSQS